MAIKAKSLKVGLPFGLGQLDFEANEVEQRAAWALYVELETRVATKPFDKEHGSIRNVLTSLYPIFNLTRGILREGGPELAHGPNSFGVIAIKVLTEGIAPFTLWHQPLHDYEQKRPPGVGVLEHEKAWEHYHQVVDQLEKLQEQMRIYADVLAQISGAK